MHWSMHQVAHCPEAGKAIDEKRAMLIARFMILKPVASDSFQSLLNKEGYLAR